MSFSLNFILEGIEEELRGRPQPLKKSSQSQKGHLSEKMNAINDTNTPELTKSAKEEGNTVIFCGICQSLD